MKKRFRKIYLEISNVCNLNCAFCPGTTRKPGVMSEEAFASLLPKLRPWSDFLYFHRFVIRSWSAFSIWQEMQDLKSF